jgi:hypothetical protein
MWSRRFGGPDDQRSYDVAATADGGAVLTGYMRGTMDVTTSGPLVGAGEDDVFVVRVDGAGAVVGAHRFGGTGKDFGEGVSVDETGNALLIGNFQGSVDFGGPPLLAPSGLDPTGSQLGGSFAVKLDPFGEHVWSVYLGDTTLYSGAKGTAPRGDGGVFATSLYAPGQTGVLFTLLQTEGMSEWKRLLPTQGAVGDPGTRGAGVASDAFGDVAVAGSFTAETIDLGFGPVAHEGGLDAFVAKLDAQGEPLWARTAGAADDQQVEAVATDKDGNVVVVGSMRFKVDFGGGEIASSGDLDAFVVKYSR